MDNISLERLRKIHPALIEEAILICAELDSRNLSVRFTDVYRSIAEQEELYAQGRTKPGSIVTKARGGQSYHNYGLAIDFCLLKENPTGSTEATWNRTVDINENNKADWEEVVFVFKHYGWEWGGDWPSFKDYPHFERNFGYTTKQLKEKIDNAEIDSNGYVLL